jgi:hypothetical protein
VSKVKYSNGVHIISNAEYHASEGISRSMLMEFKRSPYHYWYKYISGLAEKEEATPAMNLGNAVHTLVLEETKFDDEFYIINQATRPRRNTPPHEKMMANAQGKIILTRDEYLQAAQMALAVKDNYDASSLLQDCLVEQSIYFTHELTGWQVKARPDAMIGHVVIDLKTTADASMRAFKGSAVRYGYFLQAAMVGEALKSINQHMEHFVFIPVEKVKPYCVAIYIADDESIAHGLSQFDELMIGLAKCLESGVWPGYGLRGLSLPKYAMFDDIQEIE